jgi:hypothetical protein
MKQLPQWFVPTTTIGSLIIMAVTLLHYAQSRRAGVPGGYSAICFGSLAVGLITSVCIYFATAPQDRSVPASLMSGVFSAMVSAAILFATLIWVFGS